MPEKMPDWEREANDKLVAALRKSRQAMIRAEYAAEYAAEDAALLNALNVMGTRGLGRSLTFTTNDRDSVMAALHDAGFDVAREKYIKKPF